MFHKKLKFKVLVSYRSGSVAALETSLNTWSDSSVICWRRGVLVCVSSSVKTSQQRLLCRTPWSGPDKFKTIPRNTPWYSHGSLGHGESAIKRGGDTDSRNVVSNAC